MSVMVSCNKGGGNDLDDEMGVEETTASATDDDDSESEEESEEESDDDSDDDGGAVLNNLKVLKIVEAGVGSQAEFTTHALIISEDVAVKAALFDLSGNYLSDAAADWTIDNTDFSASNLGVSGDDITATFTPTYIGDVLVRAAYTGSDTSVINGTDYTGTITVTNTQTPDSLAKTSGDAQTGIVNNNLGSTIKVRVLDEFSQGIDGEQVLFSVITGSGSIIGTNPVTTSGDGYAEVTIKLGTAAGGDNNQYRATVVGYGSLTQDFTAIATAGAADHMTFTTQPALLFEDTAFGVQPVVEVRDEYENLLDVSGTATMTVSSGSGALGGTATAAIANGEATFADLEYDTGEAGVVFQVSNSSVTGDSDTLTIGAAPPGACAVNDASFITSDGGCKDINSGLVWSELSSSASNWYKIVWNAALTGAPNIDADDYGRSNHLPTVAQRTYDCESTTYGIQCDDGDGTNDTIAYCKSLNEGTKTDWRMPTTSELQQVYSNGATTHLDGAVNNYYWSSDSCSVNSSQGCRVHLTSGTTGVVAKASGSGGYSVCVRGGWNDADALEVSSDAAEIIGVSEASSSVTIQVVDTEGDAINAGEKTITLSSTNLGTLGGTLTATTDRYGVATFDAFTLDTAGNATLTFTATGLASIDHDIEVRAGILAGQHICGDEDSRFITQNGGCHDTTTDIVWSARSDAQYYWHHVIWDSTAPTGNDAPDGDDNGRTDEYDVDNLPSGANSFDGSFVDYCHDLDEGGYTDWRVPTSAETSEVGQAGQAGLHFDPNYRDVEIWTSTTRSNQRTSAYYAKFTTSSYSTTFKYKASFQYYATCIREP